MGLPVPQPTLLVAMGSVGLSQCPDELEARCLISLHLQSTCLHFAESATQQVSHRDPLRAVHQGEEGACFWGGGSGTAW